MKGSKKCRVIRAYDKYRVGDEIYPAAMLRDHLFRNGYIEIMEDDPASVLPVVEAATAPTGETTVMPAPFKRGRGRPRKDQSHANPIA